MKKPVKKDIQIQALQERLDHIEGAYKKLIDYVSELSASREFNKYVIDSTDPFNILNIGLTHIKRLLSFEELAFYLIEEKDASFYAACCEPESSSEKLGTEVNQCIEDGTFAWALRQNHPIVVPSKLSELKLILHVLGTQARTRGMFVGTIKDENLKINDLSVTMLSITVQDISYSLESVMLYQILRKNSEEALRQSHHKLGKAHSDLKAAKSQMLRQEKMASIGQLSAGIAHEIKNPLGIIVQGIDSLKDSLTDSLLADTSERIKNASLRAARIVNDLLSFARQSPIAPEKMDIVSIIEETLSLVEHQLNLNNIVIIRRFEEGTLSALVDSDQIKQVFINVLLNAADAMRQGGNIEIEAGTTVMPTGTPAVRISFSDNGCGIEPENIEKIFDPFFTTKRDSGGTGLGLAVSQRIIENHRGTITVDSRLGEGTKVLVTLPAPEQ